MSKMRIVLFGTGSISKMLTEHIGKNTVIVAYFAQNHVGKINGIPVISAIDQLRGFEFDFIVVAFGNSLKGIEILRKEGIPSEKIIGYAYTGLTYADNVFQEELDRNLAVCLNEDKIPLLFDIPAKRYYFCGTNVQENQNIIQRDFVREQTLNYLSEEIHRRKITGDVMEIGVSSGDFARKINLLFSDRNLYLFDSYKGIDEEDKQYAISLGWGEKLYALGETGTSAEEVLNNMPFPQKCIIKQGWFPDSFDLTGPFSLVSLDLDFYSSTKKSLEIIFPYLSTGGYIMAHDYNNLAFLECKKAITEFCDENNVSYVPIPDIGGTVVITK